MHLVGVHSGSITKSFQGWYIWNGNVWFSLPLNLVNQDFGAKEMKCWKLLVSIRS